jgi:hypothetical protein
MKRIAPFSLAVVSIAAMLAACGGTHGLRDNVPKLSSHTDKSATAYAECASGKWRALAPAVNVTSKDDVTSISATGDKDGARELLDVTTDGTGAQVVMYENQNAKKDYDVHYREEANGCL